jgi:hypothetical protein
MINKQTDYRRRASRMARALRKGEVTFEAFIDEFYDSRDPEVSKLVDWIESEPRHGNFFGVSDQVYFFYQSRLDQLIGELESGQK